MIFKGYNPYAPQRQPTPPTVDEIPPAVKQAAKHIHATHLSKDGRIAYQLRFGKVRWAEWLSHQNDFGSWFPFGEELPAETVVVE